GRIANNKILNNLSTLYVELIRGIPIIVLIFYIALVGVPSIIEAINGFGEWLIAKGISSIGVMLSEVSIRKVPNEGRAIFALSVTYGAFLAEIFRAGIQSIGRGQSEAARSLGMSRAEALRYVVLPQAIRNVLPALANDFVAMVKDSSLVSVLAVADITQRSRKYTGTSFVYKESYNILATLYLTMTVTLSIIVRSLEKRLIKND
ncbi:MAG: amino acid ABC transporter permease, partial [Chloroflexota bacterium]